MMKYMKEFEKFSQYVYCENCGEEKKLDNDVKFICLKCRRNEVIDNILIEESKPE